MELSAIYPLPFGEAVAQIYGWEQVDVKPEHEQEYFRFFAESLPNAKTCLRHIKEQLEHLQWDYFSDKDPGFPGWEAYLPKAPKPDAIKSMRATKRLANESKNEPLLIASDSEETMNGTSSDDEEVANEEGVMAVVIEDEDEPPRKQRAMALDA